MVEKVEKLVEKVDNVEYVIGLVHKMLKGKELGVSVEEIKIPTHLVESREEDGEETRENISYSSVIDPQGASSIGTTTGVDKVSERIALVIKDLNIPPAPIPDE